jgi:hypothetical protein
MSVFEKIFGSRNPAPAQQQPAATNNPAQNAPTMQTASSAGTAPNGVVPAGSAAAPVQEAAPMEKFKDLWTPPAASTENQGPAPVDPQKLMEAASKVDFSKVIDPESMQKIAAGGEEAAQALALLLNKTAQQVYGQSAVTTAKIVEQAVAQARDQFMSEIPATFRKQTARDAVFSENPAFSNPAVAPLIEAQVSQLALKYPKATPVELQAMAKEYLADVANLIAPQKREASPKNGTANKGEDWDDYMS